MRGTIIGVTGVGGLFAFGAACAGLAGACAGGAETAYTTMDGGAGGGASEGGWDFGDGGVIPSDGSVGASPTGPAIYVATSGVDTAAGTSPAAPLKTIQAGLDLAAKCPGKPCSVLVSAGTYVQSLQLRDGVSLYGQYQTGFTARAASSVVTIASGDNQTIVASGLTKPTTIDGVTIQGGSLSSADGRSTYTVWVHGSGNALLVSNAEIFGGKAAAGMPGAAGAAIACQSSGGAGGSADDCGSSAGGAGAASGDPVTAGDGGSGGGSNCPSVCPLVGSDGIGDGTPGSPGGNGADGLGGSAAANVFGTLSGALWTGDLGGAGTRGMHGTGGGGGGSGGSKKFVACFSCSTLLGGNGSAGAPGGCGGGGGGPGSPGGGSFALVTDSSVTLQNVMIVGGFGGAGGAGGAGAPGTLGGPADAGAPGPAGSQKCGALNYSSGAGAAGGPGGVGGNGGGGAGAAGGPSIGVATTAGGQVTQYHVTVTAGTPGTGGAGGMGVAAGAVGLTGGVATLRAY